MSLGLNDNATFGAPAPDARHKSAGLAFGLSVLLPGLGQLYCGKTGRGGMTLGVWLLSLGLAIARISPTVFGYAIVVMLVLWIFSFLDAYFTAIEINKGQDEIVDVQNPRVAVMLNLLTSGFGYFYLGERTKGITLFIAMQVARLVLPATGWIGSSISLALLIVQLLVAEDAYRIARRQVKEALGPEPPLPIAGVAPVLASRLPVQVPVVLACLISVGFVVLVVIGLVWGPQFGSQTTVASAKNQGQRRVKVGPARDDTPVPVVDFPTAVQDVQRVQRETLRTKEEFPNLKLDVRMLSDTLGAPKVDSADKMVAHYYRALALSMMNGVREHDGEAIDVSGARRARADLDTVIGSGNVFTYVPEVTISNAEYWAGGITRNQLHDETAAYGYWEKCASNAHAGCMNDLAGAHITGEGGEKVDLHEALELHTAVYNSGIRYRCAGALSAASIANINYFTGVRRSGDDEIEWTKKAEALMDKLETAENRRNVCRRANMEVNEFLFQLSRGHRDDTILQDAVSRLDDDSVTTKAVIQFISGALDEKGFEAAVNESKLEGSRCTAYFDAMWYSELRKEDAMARRYYQQMVEIGKFHCGQHLVFAGKYKF